MSDTLFDVEVVFDASDYLYFYFYETVLTPERTAREVDLIWQLLDLRPGVEVLDLACGHGRIANPLAARGCAIVGLDVTPAFLEVARRDAAAQGLAVEYVEGDMRALPWSGRFDRIVNWFTAYGYFDDDGNRAVLAEAHRALKPEGKLLIKLLIELNNRDYVLRHYQHAAVVERDDDFMIDRMRYDVATGRNITERVIVRDGRVRRMGFFVRLLTYRELAAWLHEAGFRHVAGYDRDGQLFTLESRRMIVVAEK